jgi:2'-5' RNA ligase
MLHPRPLPNLTETRRTRALDALDEIESAACAVVDRACAQLAPIRVSLGDVATFAPAHPTVYLPVEDGARHLRYLNSLLKAGPLDSPEPWEYVPHLTLATFPDNAAAARAREFAAAAWQEYRGPREALIEELSLVREESPDRWLDLHNANLGG